jgi:hypothetical protein
MRTLQRLQRFRHNPQGAEVRVAFRRFLKQSPAIVAQTRAISVGDDTDVDQPGVHAHESAVTTGKQMQLNPVVQSVRSAKMRLEGNATVRRPVPPLQPGLSRDDGMSAIGSDDT